MRDFLVDAVGGFNWFVIFYFLAINSLYLVMVLIAAAHTRRAHRIPAESALEDLFANPLTPGVSVLVPAYNEEKSIVSSVQAIMALRYPVLEVVIAEDGSTDDTFEALRVEFELEPCPRVPAGTIETIGTVRSVHSSPDGRIIVVRKDNAGRRGDALNVALEYSRFPLVCMIDADSVMERDALLQVVRPFMDDPERVAATGGAIRPINGCPTDRGEILEKRAPKGWSARIQVVEYLRSFLLGRVGWSAFNSLLIISGAFGLFRRDLVVQIGGLTSASLAEDADLVNSLHRRLREDKADYRIVFVPHPVCWTEVPENLKVLSRQRRRWSHGLFQVLWRFKGMILNPRYGRVGLLLLPYYVVFELLSPLIEVLGLLAVVAAFFLGILNTTAAVLYVLAALGFGVLLSIVAIVVDELTYQTYRRWSDFAVLVAAAFLENLGFRQLHAVWRLRGLWSGLRGANAQWGEMTRVGFTQAKAGYVQPKAA
jgi:cellulose synthase/poly-beta-1,6-N-acetylglucosamine synthase-like glycosyltransferase